MSAADDNAVFQENKTQLKLQQMHIFTCILNALEQFD